MRLQEFVCLFARIPKFLIGSLLPKQIVEFRDARNSADEGKLEESLPPSVGLS